jgi:hypothetical protein
MQTESGAPAAGSSPPMKESIYSFFGGLREYRRLDFGCCLTATDNVQCAISGLFRRQNFSAPARWRRYHDQRSRVGTGIQRARIRVDLCGPCQWKHEA